MDRFMQTEQVFLRSSFPVKKAERFAMVKKGKASIWFHLAPLMYVTAVPGQAHALKLLPTLVRKTDSVRPFQVLRDVLFTKLRFCSARAHQLAPSSTRVRTALRSRVRRDPSTDVSQIANPNPPSTSLPQHRRAGCDKSLHAFTGLSHSIHHCAGLGGRRDVDQCPPHVVPFYSNCGIFLRRDRRWRQPAHPTEGVHVQFPPGYDDSREGPYEIINIWSGEQ